MFKYFEVCTCSVQKLGLGHDWNNYCDAQLFLTLNKVNLVELVELDVVIYCKKNVHGNHFQLRLEKI